MRRVGQAMRKMNECGMVGKRNRRSNPLGEVSQLSRGNDDGPTIWARDNVAVGFRSETTSVFTELSADWLALS